jgi:DNA repair exonuclease SbcCD ATPase subunit
MTMVRVAQRIQHHVQKDTPMTNTTPPPGDPAWGHIRLRYEQDQETVAQIAQDVGLTAIALAMLAKKCGWTMRGRVKPVPKTKPKKAETAAETIEKLKVLLQKRFTALEEEIKALGKDVSAAEHERQIRSTNTLVRTMEKVIELARKEKLRKRKLVADFKYFNDQQRQQLAAKIERLQRAWRGEEAVADPEAGGGGGPQQPVALLGETGPTTAASGH